MRKKLFLRENLSKQEMEGWPCRNPRIPEKKDGGSRNSFPGIQDRHPESGAGLVKVHDFRPKFMDPDPNSAAPMVFFGLIVLLH